MKNQIIQLGAFHKVMVFDNESILMSDHEHNTLESIQSDPKKKVIPLSSVNELHYFNPNGYFFIEHLVNGKNKREVVLLKDTSIVEAVVASIAEVKKFSKGEKIESKKGSLIVNAVIALFIAFVLWSFYSIAAEAEAGGQTEVYGRRRGLKQIMISVTESIGTTGVLAIGGVILLYFVYKTINGLKKPAVGVSYKN